MPGPPAWMASAAASNRCPTVSCPWASASVRTNFLQIARAENARAPAKSLAVHDRLRVGQPYSVIWRFGCLRRLARFESFGGWDVLSAPPCLTGWALVPIVALAIVMTSP